METRGLAVGGPILGIWAGYSLAERDRRWDAVRENAARPASTASSFPLAMALTAVISPSCVRRPS